MTTLTQNENFVLGSSYYRRSRLVVNANPNGQIEARSTAVQYLEACIAQRKVWTLDKSCFLAEFWLAELVLAQQCDHLAVRVKRIHQAIRYYFNFFWAIILGGVELPQQLLEYLSVLLPKGFEYKYDVWNLPPNRNTSLILSQILANLKQESRSIRRLADLSVTAYLDHDMNSLSALRASVFALVSLEKAVLELAGMQMLVPGVKREWFQEIATPSIDRPKAELPSVKLPYKAKR